MLQCNVRFSSQLKHVSSGHVIHLPSSDCSKSDAVILRRLLYTGQADFETEEQLSRISILAKLLLLRLGTLRASRNSSDVILLSVEEGKEETIRRSERRRTKSECKKKCIIQAQ